MARDTEFLLITYRSFVHPGMKDIDEILDVTVHEMRALADRLDVKFVSNERALFASEGSIAGEKWKQLTPEYAAWKRRWTKGKIMSFRGQLRKSLTNRTHGNHFKSFAMRPRPSVTLGTFDVKGAWHGPIENNPAKNLKMPVRDVMAHSRTMEDKYFVIVNKLFQKKGKRWLRATMAKARLDAAVARGKSNR